MNASKILAGFAIILAGFFAFHLHKILDYVQTAMSGVL